MSSSFNNPNSSKHPIDPLFNAHYHKLASDDFCALISRTVQEFSSNDTGAGNSSGATGAHDTLILGDKLTFGGEKQNRTVVKSGNANIDPNDPNSSNQQGTQDSASANTTSQITSRILLQQFAEKSLEEIQDIGIKIRHECDSVVAKVKQREKYLSQLKVRIQNEEEKERIQKQQQQMQLLIQNQSGSGGSGNTMSTQTGPSGASGSQSPNKDHNQLSSAVSMTGLQVQTSLSATSEAMLNKTMNNNGTNTGPIVSDSTSSFFKNTLLNGGSGSGTTVTSTSGQTIPTDSYINDLKCQIQTSKERVSVYKHMSERLNKEVVLLSQKVHIMETDMLQRAKKETKKSQDLVQKTLRGRHQETLKVFEDVKNSAQSEYLCKQEAIQLLFATLTAKKQNVRRKADFERWRKEVALEAANESFFKRLSRLRLLWAIEKLQGNALQKSIHIQIEKSSVTEEGLNRIRELTGLTSVLDIVHRLLDRDSYQLQLQQSLREADEKLVQLREENQRFRMDSEELETMEICGKIVLSDNGGGENSGNNNNNNNSGPGSDSSSSGNTGSSSSTSQTQSTGAIVVDNRSLNDKLLQKDYELHKLFRRHDMAREKLGKSRSNLEHLKFFMQRVLRNFVTNPQQQQQQQNSSQNLSMVAMNNNSNQDSSNNQNTVGGSTFLTQSNLSGSSQSNSTNNNNTTENNPMNLDLSNPTELLRCFRQLPQLIEGFLISLTNVTQAQHHAQQQAAQAQSQSGTTQAAVTNLQNHLTSPTVTITHYDHQHRIHLEETKLLQDPEFMRYNIRVNPFQFNSQIGGGGGGRRGDHQDMNGMMNQDGNDDNNNLKDGPGHGPRSGKKNNQNSGKNNENLFQELLLHERETIKRRARQVVNDGPSSTQNQYEHVTVTSSSPMSMNKRSSMNFGGSNPGATNQINQIVSQLSSKVQLSGQGQLGSYGHGLNQHHHSSRISQKGINSSGNNQHHQDPSDVNQNSLGAAVQQHERLLNWLGNRGLLNYMAKVNQGVNVYSTGQSSTNSNQLNQTGKFPSGGKDKGSSGNDQDKGNNLNDTGTDYNKSNSLGSKQLQNTQIQIIKPSYHSVPQTVPGSIIAPIKNFNRRQRKGATFKYSLSKASKHSLEDTINLKNNPNNNYNNNNMIHKNNINLNINQNLSTSPTKPVTAAESGPKSAGTSGVSGKKDDQSSGPTTVTGPGPGQGFKRSSLTGAGPSTVTNQIQNNTSGQQNLNDADVNSALGTWLNNVNVTGPSGQSGTVNNVNVTQVSNYNDRRTSNAINPGNQPSGAGMSNLNNMSGANYPTLLENSTVIGPGTGRRGSITGVGGGNNTGVPGPGGATGNLNEIHTSNITNPMSSMTSNQHNHSFISESLKREAGLLLSSGPSIGGAVISQKSGVSAVISQKSGGGSDGPGSGSTRKKKG